MSVHRNLRVAEFLCLLFVATPILAQGYNPDPEVEVVVVPSPSQSFKMSLDGGASLRLTLDKIVKLGGYGDAVTVTIVHEVGPGSSYQYEKTLLPSRGRKSRLDVVPSSGPSVVTITMLIDSLRAYNISCKDCKEPSVTGAGKSKWHQRWYDGRPQVKNRPSAYISITTWP